MRGMSDVTTANTLKKKTNNLTYLSTDVKLYNDWLTSLDPP